MPPRRRTSPDPARPPVPLLDAEGTRLAVKTGSAVSWLLFDLHGSVAGLCPAGSTSLADAYRYDGWGVQVASAGSNTNPYRYRGLLNLANDTGAGALLAMGAREYAPQLGTFTQQDSVAGSAANPASMNRFLYALANPATLIDPDGHMAGYVGGTATWTAPKPTGGLTTGRDCNQACIDQLNNVSGVNTYGDGGSGGGGSGKGLVPPGYEPAPDGMHWSAEPMTAGQYILLDDDCVLNANRYFEGDCDHGRTGPALAYSLLIAAGIGAGGEAVLILGEGGAVTIALLSQGGTITESLSGACMAACDKAAAWIFGVVEAIFPGARGPVVPGIGPGAAFEGEFAAARAEYSVSSKIASQMERRGWTEEQMLDTILNPVKTHSVWDLSTKQPATAFVRSDGGYIVVNDISGEIVQISNYSKPTWQPSWLDAKFRR
jgi:RHS repeat-associated protein